MPPFGAIAALLWARWTGTPLRELGFRRPRSWPWTLVGGVALGLALKLVLKALVLPLLGAPTRNSAYAQLAGNLPLLVQLAITTVIVGGIGEEIFWRGFLFQRLGALLGPGPVAAIATVAVTTVAFALAHFSEQGVPGVEQALGTGLTFGALFAWQRQLWPVMIAHATYDLFAIALIYTGQETALAHTVFR